MTLEYGTPEYGTPEYGSHYNIIDTWTESTTGWTATATASVTTDPTHYVGTVCVRATIPNSVQKIRLTFASPLDTTGTDRLCMWLRTFAKSGNYQYLRCHTNTSNYYEITTPFINTSTGVWTLNGWRKGSFTPVGLLPRWESIAYIEFQIQGNLPYYAYGMDGLGFYDGQPSLGTIHYGTPHFDPSP